MKLPMYYISFFPLIDPFWIWFLSAFAAVLIIISFISSGRKSFGRVLALTMLILALWNPNLFEEQHSPTGSIVLVLLDRTSSQKLGTRQQMTDQVRSDLEQKLSEFKGSEIRYIDIPDGSDNSGTRLYNALTSSLTEITPERLAGVIVVSDGVVHDLPDHFTEMNIKAPIHVLITGRPDEKDRQIRFLSTPRFALVGKTQRVKAEVQEKNGTGSAPVQISLDGKLIEERVVSTNKPFTFKINIEHAGINVVEIKVKPLDEELTLLNNHAVLSIDGVRDKLRVLLVSGAPHAGGLTWRNLLKSDPNIDLVHFTILRNIMKTEHTPNNEMALIVFPTTELFVEKINEFDLIIFDRYDNYGVLPFDYFRNIARYVQQGGALLIAAGPEFVDDNSLALTPLQPVIPAFPDGVIYEEPFKPLLTKEGIRHPVTRDLAGADISTPQWGEWLRQLGTTQVNGSVLLSGNDQRPLLVLGNYGEGRSALILSDHPWLWARNYRGGGPHADLLRRITHWLMKEPALEAETLRASSSQQVITIERQTMGQKADDVILESPDGSKHTISLKETKPGLFTSTFRSEQNGMHLVSSGSLKAFVNIGPGNLKEMEDIFSTLSILQPLTKYSKGSIRRLIAEGRQSMSIPQLRLIKPYQSSSGSDWIGLLQTESYSVTGVKVLPLGIGFLALFLVGGSFLIAWLIEGRNRGARDEVL